MYGILLYDTKQLNYGQAFRSIGVRVGLDHR